MNNISFPFALFRILQNRWQYFYKSQVLRGFSPGASDQPIPIEDQPEHVHELLAILNGYGQALFHIIDPHITQTVLTSLQCLHERWKLFNRQFFRENLLASFLNTLLTLLISTNGVLHQDQLINVLFNMSQTNETVLKLEFETRGYERGQDICSAKVKKGGEEEESNMNSKKRCADYLVVVFPHSFSLKTGLSDILSEDGAICGRCEMCTITMTIFQICVRIHFTIINILVICDRNLLFHVFK